MTLISLGVSHDGYKSEIGNSSSEVVYLDDNDKVVEQKDATKFIINQYDKDGNLINTIRGPINNSTAVENTEIKVK